DRRDEDVLVDVGGEDLGRGLDGLGQKPESSMQTSHFLSSRALTPSPLLGSRSPMRRSTSSPTEPFLFSVMPRLKMVMEWPRLRAISIRAGPMNAVPPRMRIFIGLAAYSCVAKVLRARAAGSVPPAIMAPAASDV